MCAVGSGGGNRLAQNRVYLTGDMIPFRVIDLLCHLFPPFFHLFVEHGEAASVIDEPGRVHLSPPPSQPPLGALLGSLQCNEQWRSPVQVMAA